MKLYHTGFEEIRDPDIRAGRANADFGQGFYLSPDYDFSMAWSRLRKDKEVIVNSYELDTDGLKIFELKRDEEWYDYIFHNRNGYPDRFKDADVLIGPIANDTIYDTWGILTSGFLSKEKSLKLLSLGPDYSQVVIKSSKALSHLHFLSSSVIPKDTVYENKKKQREEEKAYQEALLSHLKDKRELFE